MWSFAILLMVGCNAGLPGKPNPKDRPIPPDRQLSFEVLFANNCAGCHGKDGKQGPAPPLNDPLFRSIIPVGELSMVVSDGREGTLMPPFAHSSGGPLTDAQVNVLVNEIKGRTYRIGEKETAGRKKIEVTPSAEGITPAWGVVEPAPESVPAYLLPEASGNETTGAKLFAKACADCHGKDGEGILRNGEPQRQINDPAFLALLSEQAIRRIIITGRPDFGMPNFSEKKDRPPDFKTLNSADVADLTAFIGSWPKGSSRTQK